MDRSTRTLVMVLCMHRSGSSLTTSILRELGMSLGPFELLGALPSNPHGHFEAIPIMELNQEILARVHGFEDHWYGTSETMAAFVQSGGKWKERVDLPDDLYERGRSLIGALIDSGEVSGFKDPRTALLWPFWRRVLRAFPDLRVVPLIGLRSPHEIAMSLFKRHEGEWPYATYLDLVAVHLRQIKAFLDDWPTPAPRVRFGGAGFLEDLTEAAACFGLNWEPSVVRRVFDDSCVHHVQAAITHVSQDLYEELGGDRGHPGDWKANLAIVESDAHVREGRIHGDLDRLRGFHRDLERNAADMCERLRESVTRAWEFEMRAWNTQEELKRSQYRLSVVEEELRRSQAHAGAVEGELRRSLDEAQELRRSLEDRDRHVAKLQAHLNRFEQHPLVGPALRGRRRMRTALRSLKRRATDWSRSR